MSGTCPHQHTLSTLWVCICHTYENITDVLHMRTMVRIHNSYKFIRVPHVEFYTCANNTESSQPIKLQSQTAELCVLIQNRNYTCKVVGKKGNRTVQGVPQSQAAALHRHQEEEELDKTKQAQIEQSTKISSLFHKRGNRTAKRTERHKNKITEGVE